MIMGDLNVVIYSHEQSSGNLGNGNKDRALADMVQNVGLINIVFSGPLFTWSRVNMEETFISACLDRVLCNAELSSTFLDATLKHLPCSHFDHCPILLRLDYGPYDGRGAKRFFFQATWFSHPNFIDCF